MPQPLLWQPASGLQWQAAVPGRVLLDVGTLTDATRAAAVGTLVATLHATPAAAAPVQTLASLHQRLHLSQAVLCQTPPALMWRLVRLAASLEAGLTDARWASLAGDSTLHGGLHARKVLIDGHRLALIDFDRARRGPALLELG